MDTGLVLPDQITEVELVEPLEVGLDKLPALG
jgi:hypothetical protein